MLTMELELWANLKGGLRPSAPYWPAATGHEREISVFSRRLSYGILI